MPIVPNYMNQVNAQNWAEGLGSVVQALNNPQAFANADLLRAKKAEIEANIAYQQGKLGLDTQELGYKKNVYAAQANNQNADAAYHNAQARSQDLVGQQVQLQTKAMAGLGARLMATGVPEADAMLGQDLIVSGSAKSTSENNADAINKILQRSPVTIPQGGSVLLPPSSPLLPQNQPQQPAQANLGTALTGRQSGPVFNGNMVSAPTSAGKSLTPAQKAVDEAFGKEYADMIARGEQFDVGKQLAQLDFAKQQLENPTGLGVSGPILGAMPDFVKKIIAPQAINTRQAVEESVQRNLRAILGAQFTAKEGEQLIQRSYDQGVSEEENLRRLNLLASQMKAGMGAKQDAMRYYEGHGTLDGWQGTLPKTSDFNPSTPPKIGRPPLNSFIKQKP